MAHLSFALNWQTLNELMLEDRTKTSQNYRKLYCWPKRPSSLAVSYQRTDDPVTYHSGYPTRQLTTRVGSLPLHVPKFRVGTFLLQLFNLQVA